MRSDGRCNSPRRCSGGGRNTAGTSPPRVLADRRSASSSDTTILMCPRKAKVLLEKRWPFSISGRRQFLPDPGSSTRILPAALTVREEECDAKTLLAGDDLRLLAAKRGA